MCPPGAHGPHWLPPTINWGRAGVKKVVAMSSLGFGVCQGLHQAFHTAPSGLKETCDDLESILHDLGVVSEFLDHFCPLQIPILRPIPEPITSILKVLKSGDEEIFVEWIPVLGLDEVLVNVILHFLFHTKLEGSHDLQEVRGQDLLLLLLVLVDVLGEPSPLGLAAAAVVVALLQLVDVIITLCSLVLVASLKQHAQNVKRWMPHTR